MTFKTLIASAALALSLSACTTTQIIYADSSPDSAGETSLPGSASSEDAPGTSSWGPQPDPTTGAGEPEDSTTGLLESTGPGSSSSTGGESSGSSSSTGSSSSSTGEAESTGPGEVAVDCPFAGKCDGGVCAPDGSCVAACQDDGRCENQELCLVGACVDVGSDMMEAQLIAWNDSPAGAVSAFDTDVWKVKLPYPGDFAVIVSGKPVSAFILSGMQEIIATPADAEILDMEGMNSKYSFAVEDVTLPISVLLMSSSEQPVAYYFYTVKP